MALDLNFDDPNAAMLAAVLTMIFALLLAPLFYGEDD